jgi:outer membrane murein-binding lipoprotein Lpp
LTLKLRQDVKLLEVRQVCGVASPENIMRYVPKVLMASIFVPALLLTAGCAQQKEVSILRSEISAMRSDLDRIQSVSQEAAASAKKSAEAAERAAAEAKAASQKADEIYRQSLRK